VSLTGGGTDFKDYYEKYEGHVVSFAIQQYVYITLNKRFLDGIRFAYSKTEIVENSKELDHNICREVLQTFSINSGLEIATVADVPSRGTGLASSSAFTSALIKAVSEYQGIEITKDQLAQQVCELEIDKVKAPIGKQDQYASVFGGLNSIKFLKNEKVEVNPINIEEGDLNLFESSIALVYTGLSRDAGKIISEQLNEGNNDLVGYYEKMHRIKDYSNEIQDLLMNMDLQSIGNILNESWDIKRSLSDNTSNSIIDDIYSKAISLGAFGGKLLGAGGGGFILLICPPDRRKSLLEKLGCKFILPKIDFDGTSLIYKKKI
jgi:D-glycero-alpha-D-manno-heptose-7-phosphate kinase